MSKRSSAPKPKRNRRRPLPTLGRGDHLVDFDRVALGKQPKVANITEPGVNIAERHMDRTVQQVKVGRECPHRAARKKNLGGIAKQVAEVDEEAVRARASVRCRSSSVGPVHRIVTDFANRRS
ncbi:MAG: hypothetical protein ACI9C1_000066 [Candidatus Aldehydirespiratoraceae bacterium]